MRRTLVLAVVGIVFFGGAGAGRAQDQSAGQSAPPPLSTQALDNLVAPIALYPDPLIAQVLPASAYPLEVVQAARWLDQNRDLQKSDPDKFKAALEQQDWDPSVKALVSFPSVLQMMNDKLEWTGQLGDAFVNQQKDVMSAIQDMRAKAQSAGSLKTTQQQKVVVQQDRIIEIQPADPEVIYVPTYSPQVVYAAPPYGYSGADMFAASALSFGLGVAVGAAWGGGCNWGGGFVYNNYNINNFNRNGHWINPNRYGPHNLYNPQNNQPWRPDPNRRQAEGGQGWNRGQGGRPVPSSQQVASELENRGWGRGGDDGGHGGSFSRTGGGDEMHGGSFSKSGQGFEDHDFDRGARGDRGGAFDGLDRGDRDLGFGDRGRASRGFGGEDFHPSHSAFDGFHGGWGGGGGHFGGFHGGRR